MSTASKKKQTPEVEVCVDTQIVNTPSVGASVLQVCQTIGVRCITRNQILPGTITWQLVHPPAATDTGPDSSSPVEEMDEVFAILPVADFVPLVLSQVQHSSGMGSTGNLTLTQFIQQLRNLHPGKHVSVAVLGVDKYFSDQKLSARRKHREEVTGQRAKGHKGHTQHEAAVTRFQVEEAIVCAQLETGCCCHLVDNAQEVAEMVKTFTKATIDKPNKKDRFDSVFSFLEEGGTGVKCDKQGNGLLKAWRLQLQQLHNLGPEMAAAIAAEYPSPSALMQAYADYPNPMEAWKVTENIVVRRGAGVLETGRRIGKQLSQRIHTLMTSNNPEELVK